MSKKDSKEQKKPENSTSKGQKHEENPQQKFVEYSVLRNQIEAISKELGMVVNTVNTLSTAKVTLEVMDKSDEEDIMFPLGGNIFVKAKLKEKGQVLTGIGADLILEKDIPSALSKLTEQIDELITGKEKLEQQMTEIETRLMQLEPEVQKLSQQLKAGHEGHNH